MTAQRIQHDKLGVLTKIAQGGQGVVYRAPNVKTRFAASMVYKKYKPQTLAEIDLAALAAMPALVEDSLTYAEAERLISLAAWPCALVEDGGTTTGFVMPAIPGQFFIPLTTVKGVSTTSAEFQHLLNHPTVLTARGISLVDTQRYTLLREVASALAFLHRSGVCIGDVSPKNLLFSLTPREAIYVIDCDATRINGVSALPQLQTPGWEAPAGEELATIYSDTYKLGLLALRLLVGDHDTTNPQHLPSTTPDLLRQAITDTLRSQPQSRPLPEAWIYVLGNAIEYARRQPPRGAAGNAATPPREPPPVPVVHSRPSANIPASRPAAPHRSPPKPTPAPPIPTPAAVTNPLEKRRQERIFAVVTIVAVAAVVGIIALVGLGASHDWASSTQTTSPVAPWTLPSATSTYTYTPVPTTTVPPPPPPDVFIGIASAQPDGWGYTTSSVSIEDAKAKAIAKCAEVNTGCEWNAVIKNGCVAIAKAPSGTIAGGTGSSAREAEQDALKQGHGGRILKSACVER